MADLIPTLNWKWNFYFKVSNVPVITQIQTVAKTHNWAKPHLSESETSSRRMGAERAV